MPTDNPAEPVTPLYLFKDGEVRAVYEATAQDLARELAEAESQASDLVEALERIVEAVRESEVWIKSITPRNGSEQQTAHSLLDPVSEMADLAETALSHYKKGQTREH